MLILKRSFSCLIGGTVDAPDMKPFNADPKMLEERIFNPERVHVLALEKLFDLVALRSARVNKVPRH